MPVDGTDARLQADRLEVRVLSVTKYAKEKWRALTIDLYVYETGNAVLVRKRNLFSPNATPATRLVNVADHHLEEASSKHQTPSM